MQLTDELYKVFYEYGSEDDEVTSHKDGKQLISLYENCENARLKVSELLNKMRCQLAVKVMKRMNNVGEFKSDDDLDETFASELIICEMAIIDAQTH